jgi:hypothetical protein
MRALAAFILDPWIDYSRGEDATAIPAVAYLKANLAGQVER